MHAPPKDENRLYRFGQLALALFCAAILGPRLASPQFGLFDDGITIQAARQILTGGWTMGFDPGAGRFRPVYWLYHALIYAVGGENPFWFFLGNLALFIATTLALAALARRWGAGRGQALVTGLLFALSGPVIENYYTLSKGEALQLLLALLGLLMLSPLAQNPTRSRVGLRILAGALLFTMAALTKETALTLIPISAGWLLLAWLASRRFPARPPFYLAALAASVFAGLAWLAGRAATGVTAVGGGYSGGYSLAPGAILASVIRWGGWLLRDEAFLLPLGLLLVVLVVRRRRISQPGLLGGTLVWMVGWVAVFLPWTYTVEYYMLAFAAGASVLGGLALHKAWRLYMGGRPVERLAAFGCLAAAGLLLFTTLASSATNARIQLATDRANAQAMDWLAAHMPQGTRLLLNIQAPNEYTTETGLHLAVLRGRPDITVETYQGGPLQPGDTVATPVISNQIRLSVRMGVYEAAQAQWNQSLEAAFGPAAPRPVYETLQSFKMLNFDLPQLFCPLMRGRAYCATPAPALNRRTFTYGWRIYIVPAGEQTGEADR